MHNVGTVPTYKMHNVGTVPTFKMHNIGTYISFFFWSLNLDCMAEINDRSLRPFLEARASLVLGLSVGRSLARSHFSSSTCQSNTNCHCYGQDGFDCHQRKARLGLRMAKTAIIVWPE